MLPVPAPTFQAHAAAALAAAAVAAAAVAKWFLHPSSSARPDPARPGPGCCRRGRADSSHPPGPPPQFTPLPSDRPGDGQVGAIRVRSKFSTIPVRSKLVGAIRVRSKFSSRAPYLLPRTGGGQVGASGWGGCGPPATELSCANQCGCPGAGSAPLRPRRQDGAARDARPQQTLPSGRSSKTFAMMRRCRYVFRKPPGCTRVRGFDTRRTHSETREPRAGAAMLGCLQSRASLRATGTWNRIGAVFMIEDTKQDIGSEGATRSVWMSASSMKWLKTILLLRLCHACRIGKEPESSRSQAGQYAYIAVFAVEPIMISEYGSSCSKQTMLSFCRASME